MFPVDKTILNAMTCLAIPQPHSVEIRNGKTKPFTMGIAWKKPMREEGDKKKGIGKKGARGEEKEEGRDRKRSCIRLQTFRL